MAIHTVLDITFLRWCASVCGILGCCDTVSQLENCLDCASPVYCSCKLRRPPSWECSWTHVSFLTSLISTMRLKIWERYILNDNGPDSLGAVYEAGDFKMSTWIPFIWAVISTLVLILSSFSIQGGLWKILSPPVRNIQCHSPRLQEVDTWDYLCLWS